jgi:hypothetical protein
MLAAAIATAGVVGDSTAVAISYGELRALLLSLGTVLTAMAVVIGFAAVLSAILPQLVSPEDNSQITARVSPTIVGLVAALATGFAGAFAVWRRDIADILPGSRSPSRSCRRWPSWALPPSTGTGTAHGAHCFSF